MKPLKEFICDTCGHIIDDPCNGTLEWISERDENGCFKSSQFKIVHRIVNSPNKHTEEGCYNHSKHKGFRDADLVNILNGNVLGYLYSFLDPNPYSENAYVGIHPENIVEFMDILRRLTIDNYEEARFYLNTAINEGFAERDTLYLFDPKYLESIINHYKDKD